jgi:hypothetical protein
MLPETYLTGGLRIEASLQNPKIGSYAYSLTFYATERLWFASQQLPNAKMADEKMLRTIRRLVGGFCVSEKALDEVTFT